MVEPDPLHSLCGIGTQDQVWTNGKPKCLSRSTTEWGPCQSAPCPKSTLSSACDKVSLSDCACCAVQASTVCLDAGSRPQWMSPSPCSPQLMPFRRQLTAPSSVCWRLHPQVPSDGLLMPPLQRHKIGLWSPALAEGRRARDPYQLSQCPRRVISTGVSQPTMAMAMAAAAVATVSAATTTVSAAAEAELAAAAESSPLW